MTNINDKNREGVYVFVMGIPGVAILLAEENSPDNVPQKYFSPPFMNGGKEIFLF